MEKFKNRFGNEEACENKSANQEKMEMAGVGRGLDVFFGVAACFLRLKSLLKL